MQILHIKKSLTQVQQCKIILLYKNIPLFAPFAKPLHVAFFNLPPLFSDRVLKCSVPPFETKSVRFGMYSCLLINFLFNNSFQLLNVIFCTK